MTLVPYAAFWACESFPSISRYQTPLRTSGLESILLLSSSGFLIDQFLSIYAGVAYKLGTYGKINVTAYGQDNNDFSQGGSVVTDSLTEVSELETFGRPIYTASYVSVYLAERCVLVLQIFLQTTLVLHVRQLMVHGNGRVRRLVLLACLTWQAWTNAFVWGIDSFIELKGVVKILMPVYSLYYGHEHYELIQHVLLPFSQLYRITSVFLFIQIILIQC